MIPNFTIYSDKVLLTANYYIEYLGFNLLYKVEDDDNPYVWLELNGQFLLIWPQNKRLGIAKNVELEMPDILNYFSIVSEKARINVPLYRNSEGQHKFSILDCEDNVLHFMGQSSSAVLVTDDPDSMELEADPQKS